MNKTTPPDTVRAAQSPAPTDPATCTAAALDLMLHYAEQPCPLVAHAIAAQLRLLSRHCVNGTATLASALLPRWQAIASGTIATTCH